MLLLHFDYTISIDKCKWKEFCWTRHPLYDLVVRLQLCDGKKIFNKLG